MREFPKIIQPTNYKYLMTIIGKNGKLENLINLLDEDKENNFIKLNGEDSCWGPTMVYWSFRSKSKRMVGFDVYIKPQGTTISKSFRERVGDILIPLLKSNYEISCIKEEVDNPLKSKLEYKF